MREQSSRKRGLCKTDVSAVNKGNREEEEISARPSFNLIEEEVLNGTVLATTTLLPEAAKESMFIVLEAMNLVCAFCDVDFRDALETYEDAADELLEEKVDIILADPPYDIKYKRNMHQSLHEVYTRVDTADLVELERKVLASGEHEHLFCSRMQL